MDRTGKFVVALAIATLIAWTFYSQKEAGKITAQRQAAAAEAAQQLALAQPAPAAPPTAAGSTAGSTAAGPAAAPAAKEKTATLRGPMVEYTFTDLGGGIARAVLLTHEAERGKQMALNEFGPIPIGAVSEAAGLETQTPFTATRDESAGSITYERTDVRHLQTVKTYTPARRGDGRDEYQVTLDLTFTNRGTQSLAVSNYFVHTGAAAPVHERDLPTYTGLKVPDGKFIDAGWFSSSGMPFFGHPERPVYTETRADLPWLGVADQYFATLVRPEVTAKDAAAQSKQRGASVWGARLPIPDDRWKESGRSSEGTNAPRYAVQGALGMPGFSLEPGQSLTQQFTIYTGPREYSRLQKLGSNEEQILDFGTWALISKTLLNSLNWLHARFGSYAAAIIVLTLIIKSLLWPMQNKATQSMKRMQLLTPKMNELKEKYADDPTRMNTEIMKLYRDYGANPLSGCVPMVVQIPIFFGFYNMLGKAVELRNSRFLWITDLSQPDTVASIAGFPLNVLPLIMAGTMLWQMRISPKSGDPSQQKMMMFMPLIFIAFCYKYASALALYWTVQNLFSVAQLYATRNQAPPQLKKKVPPAKRK